MRLCVLVRLQIASEKLRDRLQPYMTKAPTASWEDWVSCSHTSTAQQHCSMYFNLGVEGVLTDHICITLDCPDIDMWGSGLAKLRTAQYVVQLCTYVPSNFWLDRAGTGLPGASLAAVDFVLMFIVNDEYV